jgi:pimeloyl-ACP methyl ester carboxylesterase
LAFALEARLFRNLHYIGAHVMAIPDLLRHVALALSAVFASGVAVYVVVSFVMMRTHTGKRPFGEALREAMRETLWATLTQPLLPLYYFVGRKLGDGGGPVPVVLVHGYSQNRVDFLRIARVLARRGSGPLFGFNYAWFARVPKSAARLASFIEEVRRETGADEVDLVCHSLGGLVAMEHLRLHGVAARVRRCVTIASPHAGVPWQGPIVGACGHDLREGCELARVHAETALGVPCLSIYSTHDNVVHPPATSTLAHRGGRDHVVPHLSHLAILFSPEVANEVAGFLGADAEEAEQVAGEVAA